MPTVSESRWDDLKARQDTAVEDFLSGLDTTEVFRARLYGIGLRGDYLNNEVLQAIARKADRQPKAKIISMVAVKMFNRQIEYLRFNNSDSANKAVELLRKVPSVSWAIRVTDYPLVEAAPDDIKGLPYIVKSSAIASS